MPVEVDHAFIACAPGAPEADALLQLGLVEGSPNSHPGQGTANRRFYFDRFMLELLWVADPAEAAGALARRTRLWERCSRQSLANSPFGIIFRSSTKGDSQSPFRSWSYYPSYLPPGLAIEIAEATTLEEPELFYLPFVRGPRVPTIEPTNQSLPVGRFRSLLVGLRSLSALSEASRTVERLGLLTYFESREHVLEIHFEGPVQMRVDLQPVLPLVLQVAP